MKKAIVTSAVVVAVLGATWTISKTAGADTWVGSGWFPLYTFQPFSVVGVTGGTYGAEVYGTSTNAVSWNTTGQYGGRNTCDAASLLCGNYDIIIAPYLCESTPGNLFTYTTSTTQTSNSQFSNGQYYQFYNNQYYAVTDTGNCPASYAGAWEGVFVLQP